MSRSENSAHKDRDPFILTSVLNASNFTPLDLARRAHAPLRVVWLLSLARRLCSYRSSVESRQILLNRVYLLSWWLLASLPLLIAMLSCILATMLTVGWPYFAGAGLAVFVAARQAHRMRDATNRPNPFFSGTIVAGFLTTLFSFFADVTIGDSSNLLVVALYRVILFTLLLTFPPVYGHLLFMEPGRLYRGSGDLLQIIEDKAASVLARLGSSSVIERLSGVVEFFDEYCPHCDVVYPPGERAVKHCKLCDICVLDMDHHCLFIMRCVGRNNQRLFILFLFLSLCYTGFYFVCSLLTVLSGCPIELFNVDFRLTSCLLCVYERLPRCFVMLLFNLASAVWAVALLNDMLTSLAVNTPYRLRLGHRTLSCRAWISEWRYLLRILLTDATLPRFRSTVSSGI